MRFPPVLCRRYLSTRLFLSFLTFSLPSSLSLFVSLSSCSSVPQHTWGPAGDVSAWIMQESLRSCTCSPFLPSLSLSLCQCILSFSRSPCPHFSSKTIIPLRRSGMWFPVCLFFCKKKDVCSLKTKAGLHSVHSHSLFCSGFRGLWQRFWLAFRERRPCGFPDRGRREGFRSANPAAIWQEGAELGD